MPDLLLAQQQTIEILLRCGVGIEVIAKEVGVEIYQVSRLAQFHTATTFSTKLNPKDAALADAMRQLAWKASEQAMVTLEYGSPQERATLVRSIVNRSMTLVGQEKENTMDVVKDEFNQMIGQIRSPDEFDYELPEDDDAIEVGTAASDPYDS